MSRILIFYSVVLIVVLMTIAPGCTRGVEDKRLLLADTLIESRPDSALTILRSINHDSISPADKRFYNFLKVKAADKAYVIHTSDSLILEVLSSYSDKDNLYPEVLYYCGRVYSDLGDYPMALHYFREALDKMEESDSSALKINTLSQTGRILNSMRLFDDAADYVRHALEIEKAISDTLKTIYDLQLLGGIYLRSRNYPESEILYKEAMTLSRESNRPRLEAKSRMYLAAAKSHQDCIPEALSLIRGVIPEMSPVAKNYALGYAAGIYRKAGILDSAKIYAEELIHSSRDNNRDIGYHVALSPELRDLYDTDTLNNYIFAYRDFLENFYDLNMQRSALIQQSLFNYKIQERQRKKAEFSVVRLRRIGYVVLVVLLILAIVVIYQKYRHQKTKTELLETRDKLNEILRVYERGKYVLDRAECNDNAIDSRDRLKAQLVALYEESKEITISPEILNSSAYRALHNLISRGKMLHENDELWEDLIMAIEEVSPNFMDNLRLLCDGKITGNDLHTAVMIKFGISVTSMARLHCKTKGAIESRLRSLSKRIFGEQVSTRITQAIIRLL